MLALIHRFEAIEDPREDRTRAHKLSDILAIVFCAVLCGARGWEAIENFGLAKEAWLKERLHLELSNGIPSDDTFRRVISRLRPQVIAECVIAWLNTLRAQGEGEVISIDGKRVRHSYDTVTGQQAIHLVSAWASERGITLAQAKVDSKSNEITAIPVLLRLIEIAGSVVTIDAMGCQRTIAEQIINQKGDYVLALKGNQTSLQEDVKLFLEDARAHDFYQKDPNRRIPYSYYEEIDKDHGRLEKRCYWVVEGNAIEWLPQKEQWKGLNSLCAVRSERRIGGQVTVETRYFISSLAGDAKRLAGCIRSHWGIENSLHYVLDVSFGEDACGIWKDHAPENLAIMRRAAISLIRQVRKGSQSIAGLSQRAGWDISILEKILLG